ncbi:MAG: glycine cleavage system protein GcvH [bacterium]|nr:glycine cleavage system protein GcvH [bacterium]MCZ6700744.1 glycine cleavage system protein GcvH [bacterium]
MEIPGKLLYSQEHTWVRDRNGNCFVGITAYAQDQLGEIIYVDLPALGDNVEEGNSFGVVESLKAVSDLLAPISGEVVEVNEALEDGPELVNSDPYGGGWMIAVAISDDAELKNLMTAEQYKSLIEEE